MVRSETCYILKAFSTTIILDKDYVNTASSISGAKTTPKGKAGVMKIIFTKILTKFDSQCACVYDKHHFSSISDSHDCQFWANNIVIFVHDYNNCKNSIFLCTKQQQALLPNRKRKKS